MTAARESGEYDAFGKRVTEHDTMPPPSGHPTPLAIAFRCAGCDGCGDVITIAGGRRPCEYCKGSGVMSPHELGEFSKHLQGR